MNDKSGKEFHLNGTPIYLPNSTPLMLAKRSIGICAKHKKYWEDVYFKAPIVRQICDELWNGITTSNKKVEIPLYDKPK